MTAGGRAFAAIATPLPPRAVAAFAFGIVAAVAAYCLAYNALAGRTERVDEAVLWAAANVLPWFGAFELGKRLPGARGIALALVAGLATSLLLQALTAGPPGGFELVRRLPGLLLAAAGLALVRLAPRAERRPPAGTLPLPLPPARIDWIGAAGNYVEIHGAGRTLLHRAPLAAIEAELEGAGFVRIHRSKLVRRGAIARVRSVDLLLADGTSLKIGNRYRARLAEPAEIRPFVPAE